MNLPVRVNRYILHHPYEIMADGNKKPQPSSIVIRGSGPAAASPPPASSSRTPSAPVPLKNNGADVGRLAIPLGFFFTLLVPVFLGLIWEGSSLSYDVPMFEACLSSIGIGILCFILGAIRAARYGLGQRAGLGLLLGYVIPVVLLPASGALDLFGSSNDGICGLMGVVFVVGNGMLLSAQSGMEKAHKQERDGGRPQPKAKHQPTVYGALSGVFILGAGLTTLMGSGMNDVACLFALLAGVMMLLHSQHQTKV